MADNSTMSHSRVDLLDATTAPITVANYFEGGDPGPIVAALANVPEMVGPALAFIGPALGPGSTGVRYKEFAILRASALQGCTYCIRAHTTVALDVGLSSDEVRSLRGEIPTDEAFADEKERALLAWIDALAGSIGPIADDVWERARTHWSEASLIEICMTVGATMFLNRFATGLQLPTSAPTMERLAQEGME